jgi:hypothetical protein
VSAVIGLLLSETTRASFYELQTPTQPSFYEAEVRIALSVPLLPDPQAAFRRVFGPTDDWAHDLDLAQAVDVSPG